MKNWRWPIAVLCLVLAAVVIFLLRPPAAVLIGDRISLSRTEFSYYYWSEYFYFREAYGEYLSDTVDFSKPLDSQNYSADMTWQDFLVEEALSVAADTLSMTLAAEDAGFSLPPEYEESLEATWSDFLVQSGGDLNGYLRRSYGQTAEEDSFRLYLYRSHLAAAYADSLYAALDPSPEEVEAYYRSHAGEYLDEYGLTAEDNWQSQAKEDLIAELARDQLARLRADCHFRTNHRAVKIVPPAGLYEENET